jgi:8-oxo-dGTP pyrophosphatase MutT (NUDIX family)/phosphohistidine phosphatase SixA
VEVVRAAGGVVLRDGRVLLVHRPRYDDWTLPKGKADGDEADEDTAVREVLEETGVRAELVRELPGTEYVDSRGRPKRVRYWLMRPLEENGFDPNDEIGDLRWATPAEARELLSYPRDLEPLRAATEPLQVVLLRHARAGERDEWDGDDRLRPLDEKGFRQADELVTPLLELGVRNVFSSPYLRCTQTVEPLARALDVRMELADELAEGASRSETLRLLESATAATVFCTHGDVIDNVLGESLKKGEGAVLVLDGLELRRERVLRR